MSVSSPPDHQTKSPTVDAVEEITVKFYPDQPARKYSLLQWRGLPRESIAMAVQGVRNRMYARHASNVLVGASPVMH